MITDTYQVKLFHGEFDGLSTSQPDATFDDTQGYFVGFRLLVDDGTSWVCDDASAGAAVWSQDTSKDAVIAKRNREVTDLLAKHCDNWFVDVARSENYLYATGLVFGADGELDDPNGQFTFYAGDTLYIERSLRNDGYYDIITATNSKLTVIPDFDLEYTEDLTTLLATPVYPQGLQAIAARMVEFDTWKRLDWARGLSSEKIGTYNYVISQVNIAGIGYPKEVVSGLQVYKRPKVR